MIDLVLTLIGADRPGLVEAVAQTVADRGGNWLESRMIRLGGSFAGILRVEVPPREAHALGGALQARGTTGLRVTATTAERVPASDDGRMMDLELIGLDRPGLVREISQLL